MRLGILSDSNSFVRNADAERALKKNAEMRLRSFTLIELLIVVAIISILVSILLPSLRNAKDAVKKSVCMNVLKQLYYGIHITAEEEEQNRWLSYKDNVTGRFSPAHTSYWTERVRSNAFKGKVSDNPHKLSEAEPLRYDQEDNNRDGGRFFICPADTMYANATPSTDWYWVHSDSFQKYASYGLNRSAFGADYPAPAFTQLRKPESTIMLADGSLQLRELSPQNSEIGNFTKSDVLYLRHPGYTVNVLWTDGHVSSGSRQGLFYYSNKADRVCYWYGKPDIPPVSNWWR